MALTTPICATLTLAAQLFIKNFYTVFRENLTNGSVANNISQLDRWTDRRGVHIRLSFLSSEVHLTKKKPLHKISAIQFPLALADLNKFSLLLWKLNICEIYITTTVAAVMFSIFWNVIPCGLMEVYRRFSSTCRLHHQFRVHFYQHRRKLANNTVGGGGQN